MKSFKTSELLRYYISFNVDHNFRDLTKEYRNSSGQMANSIFSAVLSFLLSSYVEKTISSLKVAGSVVLSVLSFILFYIILFILYEIVSKKIATWYARIKTNKPPTSWEIKEKIDRFDHVACDYALIALDFANKMRHIGKSNQQNADENQILRTFYFYETIYYLQTAVKTTLAVVEQPKDCLSLGSDTSKIDVYRIQNMLELMKKVEAISKEQVSTINTDEAMDKTIKKQWKSIDDNIDTIDKKSKETINTLLKNTPSI